MVAVVAGREERALPWWLQFWLLMRLQYAEYREKAVLFLAFSLGMPLGVFWVLRQHVSGGGENLWLLAGSLVLSVCYGSVNFVIQRVGWMKVQGETDYYDMLPVHPSAFIAAIFTLGLLSALPGLAGTLLLGYRSLGMAPSALGLAVPLILLAAGSLSVMAVALGSLCTSMSQVILLGNLVYLVVTFLCPVLVPVERLPLLLRVTSYLLPPGEAAIALTDALRGHLTTRFWVLTGLLCLWLLGALAVTLRQLGQQKR
jgi:ABC-2 type transport system permease protein